MSRGTTTEIGKEKPRPVRVYWVVPKLLNVEEYVTIEDLGNDVREINVAEWDHVGGGGWRVQCWNRYRRSRSEESLSTLPVYDWSVVEW